MALFRPRFCDTFFPGISMVPAAEAIMFCTRKSSNATCE
jgi:hypothetical protein